MVIVNFFNRLKSGFFYSKYWLLERILLPVCGGVPGVILSERDRFRKQETTVGREEYGRRIYIIYIDNLYKEVKEKDFEDIFREFGRLEDVYI